MTTETEPAELPLTVAAARAQRSEWTLRRWISTGRLNARKVLGRVLIDRAGLDALLAGETMTATAQKTN